MNTDPTRTTYNAFCSAYDFFNVKLFAGRLPRCLVTLQRSRIFYGYFAGKRFGSIDGVEVTDEIAMNPTHFRDRTVEDSLSTLVHEMVHLQQAHFGKPSRAGYHNKEWARMMRDIGLEPSDTGAPGGKDVGQKMSHYILAGGPFARACAELVSSGFALRYVELWRDEAVAKKKRDSKTKYTCPSCELNAWAKPDVRLTCYECEELMEEELG
jgi:predicted SprT family Zn-dependent metalloprotease